MSDNHDSHPQPKKSHRLIIDFEPSTFHLTVSGDVLNIEMMRSILQQADRFFAREQDKMNVLQLQRDMDEANQQKMVRDAIAASRRS